MGRRRKREAARWRSSGCVGALSSAVQDVRLGEAVAPQKGPFFFSCVPVKARAMTGARARKEKRQKQTERGKGERGTAGEHPHG